MCQGGGVKRGNNDKGDESNSVKRLNLIKTKFCDESFYRIMQEG